MCGNPEDARNIYEEEVYDILCGACQYKVNEKLKEHETLSDYRLDEYDFCTRCRMELRTFNSISGIAYSAIRRATSENTLQYFVVERREWISKGMGFFSVKWFEPGSKSGIAFHRILNPEGKMMDVVEDYGIGTIDLKAFIKKNDKAPIQRMEYRDYMEAVKSLAELMKKNLQMIEGEFQKISSACRI